MTVTLESDCHLFSNLSPPRNGHGWDLAKFWLKPVEVARAGRFREVELLAMERIIDDNLEFLVSAWEQEKSKHVNG